MATEVVIQDTEELKRALAPFLGKLIELQDTVKRFHSDWLEPEDSRGDCQRDRFFRISDFISELLPQVYEGVIAHSKEPFLEITRRLFEKQNDVAYSIQISAGTLMSHSVAAQLAGVMQCDQNKLQEQVVKALTDIVIRMDYELDENK